MHQVPRVFRRPSVLRGGFIDQLVLHDQVNQVMKMQLIQAALRRIR
jgi:hypothetical protein